MPQELDYSHRRPPEDEPPDPRRRMFRGLALAMAALGVLIVGLLPPATASGAEGRIWADFGLVRWLMLAGVVGLMLLPPIHNALYPWLGCLRDISPAARGRIAMVIAILAGSYFIWTAHWQERDFFPKTHDEQSYLLQMRMLAQGRLWITPPDDWPLADHFETFHVTVEPVYASVYFPGTAMMYVAGVWLGWPTWLLPVIISAACVGLLFSIVTELLDGLAGLLAALVLASLSWYRMLSILLMGQIPALFLGLLMFWAWLRWREARQRAPLEDASAASASASGSARASRAQWVWLALIGACAGWMAITRPVDALCYAIPVGAGVIWELYRRHAVRRLWIASLAVIVAAAAPFLAVQLVFNKAVTGSYSQTPFEFYINKFQPQTSFGFHDFDPAVRPESRLPQKQALYDLFVVPRAKNHTPTQVPITWAKKYFRFTVDVATPARPLIILLPIGLLALRGTRQWVLFATLPLFVGLYALYTFYLEHYIVVIAPAMILVLVLSIRALERAWPAKRPMILCVITATIVFTCVSSLPETNKLVTDETFPSAMLRQLRNELPFAVQGRAVVLVRWTPGQTFSRNYHQEPVYSTEAAWPDNNRIIYAHDLAGAAPVRSPQWWRANRRIFEYYAEKQPDRQFILFDRGLVDTPTGFPLDELGLAPQLARRAREAGE